MSYRTLPLSSLVVTLRVAEDLNAKGKIDKKYLGVFQKKLQQLDPLVSMDTLNRYGSVRQPCWRRLGQEPVEPVANRAINFLVSRNIDRLAGEEISAAWRFCPPCARLSFLMA